MNEHAIKDSLRGSLVELTWSETEINNSAKLIGGKAYLNRRATEKIFKTEAPRAGIIHLATHTIIDDQNPMYSKFIFAVDDDTTEDGFLHTYELYNMQLLAEMAVLSACNTGVGKLSEGEGIMSLARGFLYAGVPSVVMSLWPIDDRSTADLTSYFYEGLRQGLGKDEALRQAKLKFLESADVIKANPFYWAGLVSIGNPNPITMSGGNHLLIWMTGLVIFVLVLIFALKAKFLKGKKLVAESLDSKAFIVVFLALVSFFTVAFTSFVLGPKQNSAIAAHARQNTSKAGTALANLYFAKARKLRNIEAKYDSANYYFLMAGAIYEKENAWEKYVSCHNLVAANFISMGKYNEALDFLDLALKTASKKLDEKNLEIARNRRFKGAVYQTIGNYSLALECYKKSLTIITQTLGEQHIEAALTYNNLALLDITRGDLYKAFEYLQKAIEIAKRREEDKFFLTRLYNNLSLCYTEFGDSQKALEYQELSLLIKLKLFGESHPTFVFNYQGVGKIYEIRGEYDKALASYEKALSISQKAYGERHESVALNYRYLGEIYFRQADYAKALGYNLKGLSVALSILNKTHPLVSDFYYQLGKIYHLQNNYKKALEYHYKALSITIGLLGEKNPFTADSYRELGNVYAQQNDFDRALNYYQKSIIALVHSFRDSNIYANPNLEDISSKIKLLASLSVKAEALYNMYSLQSKNRRDLESSLSTYQLAAALVSRMRIEYLTQDAKLALGEQASKIFKKAIQTAVGLYKLSQDGAYKENAFKFAEQNKASILQAGLSTIRAKQFAGIPDSLLEYERRLKIDLAFYEKSLFDEGQKGKPADSTKLILWRETLFSLQKGHDSLMAKFAEEYPAYYNLQYHAGTMSAKQLQNQILDENLAVVEYFIADRVIYIFTITKSNFDLTQVEREASWAEQIELMREGIIKQDHTQYIKYAHTLYQSLVEPINRTIKNKKLIIIPDGALGYLPFEVLLTKQSDEKDKSYSKLSYLIKDYQINYAYSAALLYESIVQNPSKKRGAYVGFAPIKFM